MSAKPYVAPYVVPNDSMLRKKADDISLKAAYEEVFKKDPRCKGYARYFRSLTVLFMRHPRVKTACAGHGFIFFNPDFFDRIPVQTRITVMIHEIWHLILRHLERGLECNARIHNKASDHVINLNLDREGFTFEGTNPCKDPRFLGMSTEQVYKVLIDEAKANLDQAVEDLKKETESGEFVPSSVIEELIKERLEDLQVEVTPEKIEEIKEEAVSEVETMLEEVAKAANQISPKTRQILLKNRKSDIMIIEGSTYEQVFKPYLMDPLSQGRRTHLRPSRRSASVGKGIIMAGRLKKNTPSNRLMHLFYCLDVSGSITDDHAQQSHNCVRHVKELLNPRLMTIMYWDHEIKMERQITDKEYYKNIKVNAGGSTSLIPVYRRLEEVKPEAAVILTDLKVQFPPKPSCDIIWLVPENCHIADKLPPYGKIYMIPKS